jgi:hypothetical protein
MRNLLFLLIALSQNLNCSAQDTIVRMNGKKIICKVVEITDIKVIYSYSTEYFSRETDRNVISHIKYNDGTFDLISSTSEDEIAFIENKQNKNIFGSGIFFNIQPGYSYFHKFGGNKPDPITLNLAGISLMVESRFFFGKKKMFRNGIQCSWIEIAGYVDKNNLTLYFGALNPGYCGAYLLSKTSSIEYNLNFGVGMISNYKFYFGVKITPKIEYTNKRHSFGLSYSTFLAGNEFEPIVEFTHSPYSTNTRALFHNFNISYRVKL